MEFGNKEEGGKASTIEGRYGKTQEVDVSTRSSLLAAPPDSSGKDGMKGSKRKHEDNVMSKEGSHFGSGCDKEVLGPAKGGIGQKRVKPRHDRRSVRAPSETRPGKRSSLSSLCDFGTTGVPVESTLSRSDFPISRREDLHLLWEWGREGAGGWAG